MGQPRRPSERNSRRQWTRDHVAARLGQLVAAAGLAVALGACTQSSGTSQQPALGDGQSSGQEETEAFPSEPVRFIVPSSAGGGFDTVTRQFVPYFEEALDQPVQVENVPGGNLAIGANAVLDSPGDCYTMMIHGTPLLELSYLTQDGIAYTYDAFVPLAGWTSEPFVIRVHEDAPWTTLDELLEDAREKPGEIRVATVGPTGTSSLVMQELANIADVEFNIVPYPGGSDARLAVVNGEADVNATGIFTSLAIEQDTKVLGVYGDREWPVEVTDGAPTVASVLGVDSLDRSINYEPYVSKECAEQFPDRYEALVEAFLAAAKTDGYQSAMADLGALESLNIRSADDVLADKDEVETAFSALVAELDL